MAGSLNHIVKEDGALTMESIRPVHTDAWETIEECFDLIALLAKDKATLDCACKKLGFPIPKAMPVAGKRGWK